MLLRAGARAWHRTGLIQAPQLRGSAHRLGTVLAGTGIFVRRVQVLLHACCMPVTKAQWPHSEYGSGPCQVVPVVMVQQAGLRGTAVTSVPHCSSATQRGMPADSLLGDGDIGPHMPRRTLRSDAHHARMVTPCPDTVKRVLFPAPDAQQIMQPPSPTATLCEESLCSGGGASARPGHLPPRHQAREPGVQPHGP